MSTPIEIVRAHRDFLRSPEIVPPPNTWEEFSEALAAVLRDAERFKRLERAHNTGTWSGWAEWNPDIDEFQRTIEPLRELADWLMNEGAK